MNLPEELLDDWSYEKYKIMMCDRLQSSYGLYKKLRSYEKKFNKDRKITLDDYSKFQWEEWIRSWLKWSNRANFLSMKTQFKSAIAQKLISKLEENKNNGWDTLTVYEILWVFGDCWL